MRILLTSVGSRGDMQPMVALGRALIRRGHEVVLAGPPNFAAWSQEMGLPFHPFGIDLLDLLQNERDIARDPIHAMKVMTALVRDEMAVQVEAQKKLFPEFDQIIAAAVNFGAMSVAEWAGVPCSFAVFAPGIIPAPDQTPSLLPFHHWPRVLNRPAWWLLETTFQRILGPELNRQRQGLGLPPFRSFVDAVFGPRVLYAIDPVLSDAPKGAIQTGAWTMGSQTPIPDEVSRFIESGPPPIYIGFGSVPDPDPVQTTRVFVEACRRVGTRAIISKGWAKFATEPLPEGFLAVGDVAHEQLFPRMAATVHHGGAGTTHASARAGVPQFVVPHGADQFYWGGRVEKLQVGPPPLRKTRLTVESFTEKLHLLLETPSFAQNARRLGEKLRRVDGTSEAVRYLESGEKPGTVEAA